MHTGHRNAVSVNLLPVDSYDTRARRPKANIPSLSIKNRPSTFLLEVIDLASAGMVKELTPTL